MPHLPGPTDERKTFELKNHAAFKATLVSLSMRRDIPVLESHVNSVARKWFELARIHYVDASAVDVSLNPRSVYSRAYYSAYNASKAVRYVVHGTVSLHGDDHKKVSELPNTFPDADGWISKLPLLYEHRLRADYDNWSNTASENVLSAGECLEIASNFLTASEEFLRVEYGITV